MTSERGIVTVMLLGGDSYTFTYPLSITVHDLISRISSTLPSPRGRIRRWDFHHFDSPTEDQETCARAEGRQL